MVLLQGMRITRFVSPWSTTTRIESNVSANSRLVIKFMEQFEKGLVDFDPSIGIKVGLAGL